MNRLGLKPVFRFIYFAFALFLLPSCKKGDTGIIKGKIKKYYRCNNCSGKDQAEKVVDFFYDDLERVTNITVQDSAYINKYNYIHYTDSVQIMDDYCNEKLFTIKLNEKGYWALGSSYDLDGFLISNSLLGVSYTIEGENYMLPPGQLCGSGGGAQYDYYYDKINYIPFFQSLSIDWYNYGSGQGGSNIWARPSCKYSNSWFTAPICIPLGRSSKNLIKSFCDESYSYEFDKNDRPTKRITKSRYTTDVKVEFFEYY